MTSRGPTGLRILPPTRAARTVRAMSRSRASFGHPSRTYSSSGQTSATPPGTVQPRRHAWHYKERRGAVGLAAACFRPALLSAGILRRPPNPSKRWRGARISSANCGNRVAQSMICSAVGLLPDERQKGLHPGPRVCFESVMAFLPQCFVIGLEPRSIHCARRLRADPKRFRNRFGFF